MTCLNFVLKRNEQNVSMFRDIDDERSGYNRLLLKNYR